MKNPFKLILCAFSFLPGFSNANLSPNNLKNCTKSFLDVEQRPGANALFPSSLKDVLHEVNSNEWFIKGGLGVIQSDERPGEFVGFSGIEISRDCFMGTSFSTDQLHLSFDQLSSNIKVLTLQIITQEGLFAHDLKIGGKKEFRLLSTDFRRSFRGKISDEVYTKDFSKASDLRLFLKRSTNAPKSSDVLNYELNFKIK